MLFGKHINRYYLRYCYAILFGGLALLLVDWVQLKVPELYRETINGIGTGYATRGGETVPFDLTYLLEDICKPLIFIIVAMVIGRFLWRVCLFGTAIRVETDLRSKMFAKCRMLSQSYYQVHKVGDLMSLFTNDLDTINECVGAGLLMLFDALFLGVLSFFKMMRMNGLLTLLCMIPMAFLLVISAIIGIRMEKKWDARQESFSAISDFAQESFSGIAVIKAFVKEVIELHSFRRKNEENERTNIAFTKIETLLDVFVFLFVESVIGVILGVGGWYVHRGVFNAGQLMEFISYFTTIVWPIMAISELIGMRARGKASLGRIAKLLDAETDMQDRPDVRTDITKLTGAIEMKHLTFRYPGAARDSLKDLSFRIEAAENIGIIGRTGSGKTTVADLILRTYNVPDGTLFLDGYDVNTLPISVVRMNAAYVPQDGFLFSDTIASNIAFASDAEDPEMIRSVARHADVHDNIMEFPDGYETVLGERGVTVSGGQKQRISIARALMKDAPILILDDAVSAVDVVTEKKILDSLKELRRGKTTLLMAHRVSTVEQMDRVLFLGEGTVAAFGTHTELYETCKAYRRMVDAQSLEEKEVEHRHV